MPHDVDCYLVTTLSNPFYETLIISSKKGPNPMDSGLTISACAVAQFRNEDRNLLKKNYFEINPAQDNSRSRPKMNSQLSVDGFTFHGRLQHADDDKGDG